MRHEWITTAIVATMLTGCLDDEVVSTTAAAATVFSLDVMINGAPLTPETNTGQVVHPLKLKAVKQFGSDGGDTFNGLAFFRDSSGLIGGAAYLFFAGKYSPIVGGVLRGDMDAKVVRMGVAGTGSTPDAIFLNATVQTYARGVAGQHGRRGRDRRDRYGDLRRGRQKWCARDA